MLVGDGHGRRDATAVEDVATASRGSHASFPSSSLIC
jgi:hypothetical protein